MSDEKVLTKEIAEQFLADNGSVDLSEFRAIEDEAASALVRSERSPDPLILKGIGELSKESAWHLSCYKGDWFWMAGLNTISDTPEHQALAKRLIPPGHQGFVGYQQDESSYLLGNPNLELSLDQLREIPDAIAAILCQCDCNLSLNGLMTLPDSTAEILSGFRSNRYENKNGKPLELYLSLDGLSELSDVAAEHLSNCSESLWLSGLTGLSDTVAMNLSKHTGQLKLNGIQEISDTVADALSNHKGHLVLEELLLTSEHAAKSLIKHPNLDVFIWEDDTPASVAKILRDAGHG